MLSRMRQVGFTLTEMLISLALMAIMLALAVPNLSDWLMNHQIRNAADTAMASLQLARAEAIRTNSTIQINYTVTTNADNIQEKVLTISKSDGTVLQQKSLAEDAPKVTIAPEPFTVTFNGLGRITDIPPPTPPSTSPKLELDFDIAPSILAADQTKNMRIILLPGGAMKLCDPTIVDEDSTDPRKC